MQMKLRFEILTTFNYNQRLQCNIVVAVAMCQARRRLLRSMKKFARKQTLSLYVPLLINGFAKKPFGNVRRRTLQQQT